VRLLLVAATAAEIAPLVSALTPSTQALPATAASLEAQRRLAAYSHAAHAVDVLTTGVGMVATAVWCSQALAGGDYDAALSLGVCGSFRRDLTAGTVVHVTTDRLAELGAEDDDRFLTIHEMGLLGESDFPYRAGRLANVAPPNSDTLAALPAVSGITVNTVHGNDRSIARVVERFDPDVESMEGAAFIYSCLAAGVPFAQVRAVSNVVEKRNRAAWDLPGAIRRLADTGLHIINEL
jgi:futalosine hydrolase